MCRLGKGWMVARALTLVIVFSFAVTGRAQDPPRTPMDMALDLASDDADRRNGAAVELAALGSGADPAIDELVKLLEYPEMRTRTLAYETLARLGLLATPAVLNALHKARTTPNRDEHANWLKGVLWEQGEVALPAVRAMLEETDVDRRAVAVEALGVVGSADPKTASKLLALLKDGGLVARAAYQAIGVLGRHAVKCARALSKKLTKGDADTRYGAAMALRMVLIDTSCAEEEPVDLDDDLAEGIAAAQDWLVKHQDANGGGAWRADGFPEFCNHEPKCTGTGNSMYDVGVTGLALLGLMPGGGLERVTATDDPLGPTVRRGIHWLLSQQSPDGCFGPKGPLLHPYNHAIATQVVAEAWLRTRNPLYAEATYRAVHYIQQTRRPDSGWRYEANKKDCDSSVTAWMVAALKLAANGGIPVKHAAVTGGVRWIDSMTEPEYGRTGYQQRGGQPARTQEMVDRFPGFKSESLTAISLNARALAGQTLTAKPITDRSATLLLDLKPSWDDEGHLDMYYWALGSMALHRLRHPRFAHWARNLRRVALKNQRPAPSDGRFGSWDPVDPWGPEGGRVYSTSMMLISLECVAGRVSRFRRAPLKSSDLRNALKELTLVAGEPAGGHPGVKAVAQETLSILAELPE